MSRHVNKPKSTWLRSIFGKDRFIEAPTWTNRYSLIFGKPKDRKIKAPYNYVKDMVVDKEDLLEVIKNQRKKPHGLDFTFDILTPATITKNGFTMELWMSRLYGIRWTDKIVKKLNLGDIIRLDGKRLIITEFWALRSDTKPYGHIIYAIHDVKNLAEARSLPENEAIFVDNHFLRNVKLVAKFKTKQLTELLKSNYEENPYFIGFNYIHGPTNEPVYEPVQGLSLNTPLNTDLNLNLNLNLNTVSRTIPQNLPTFKPKLRTSKSPMTSNSHKYKSRTNTHLNVSRRSVMKRSLKTQPKPRRLGTSLNRPHQSEGIPLNDNVSL
jgi:hypothetical protein